VSTGRNQRPALVGNAADPRQVRRAGRIERDRQLALLASLKAVIATGAGRLVMWDLLSRAGMFRSVWDQSGSKVYYNAGRQDFGHELLDLLLQADPALYLQMEREARELEAREDRETQALNSTEGSDGR
jgi:hypothetical protein